MGAGGPPGHEGTLGKKFQGCRDELLMDRIEELLELRRDPAPKPGYGRRVSSNSSSHASYIWREALPTTPCIFCG